MLSIFTFKTLCNCRFLLLLQFNSTAKIQPSLRWLLKDTWTTFIEQQQKHRFVFLAYKHINILIYGHSLAQYQPWIWTLEFVIPHDVLRPFDLDLDTHPFIKRWENKLVLTWNWFPEIPWDCCSSWYFANKLTIPFIFKSIHSKGPQWLSSQALKTSIILALRMP